MDECLFCKIIQGKIPSQKVYEDDEVFAFKDINPQAPVHILIIPKEHLSTTNDLTEANHQIIGKMAFRASQLAKQLNLADNGYRLVMNCNEYGGQTVFHIHLHLLGGRSMQWPPG